MKPLFSRLLSETFPSSRIAVMFCKNLSMLGALLFFLSMKKELAELKDSLAIHQKKTN